MLQRAFVIPLFVYFLTTIPNVENARASDDLPQVQIETLMGGSFGSRLKKKFYQTLFREAGDIGTTLLDAGHFKLSLRFGRLLLDYEDPNRFSLADHFGLSLRAKVPVSGVLTLGGQAGVSLLRIRDIDPKNTENPGSHLADDLKSWDPDKDISEDIQKAYLTNTEEFFTQIETELKTGKSQNATFLFDDEIPEKKYLDLFAGLRLPKEMPWTAKRVQNNKILKISDIASIGLNGGVFARVQAGWANIPSPYVGVFLRGNYQLSVLKYDNDKVLLRIETTREYGTDWGLFNEKFKIPVSGGLAFGKKDLELKIRPFQMLGQNYRSKLFARTYNVHFKNKNVEAAYNAAVHGNLTLLDDLGAEENTGVLTLSERYDEGKHRNSKFEFSFGFIKFSDVKNEEVHKLDFWDERGEFTKITGDGQHIDYKDSGLFGWAVRRTRMNVMQLESYPKSPEGNHPPRIFWNLEEVNQAPKTSERDEMKIWLLGFQPSLKKDQKFNKRLASEQLRAQVEIQIHPEGYKQLQNFSDEDIWKQGAQLLLGDSSIWDTTRKRSRWLDQYKYDTITSIYLRRNTTGQDVYDAMYSLVYFLKSKPAPEELQKWFSYHLKNGMKANWSAFYPKMVVDALTPEQRYVRLELESNTAGELWSYEEGTPDLSVYPEDWEYFTVPNLD